MTQLADNHKKKAQITEKQTTSFFSYLGKFLTSKYVQITLLALMFADSGRAFEIMLALSKLGMPVAYPMLLECTIAVALGAITYGLGVAVWKGMQAAYHMGKEYFYTNKQKQSRSSANQALSKELKIKLNSLNQSIQKTTHSKSENDSHKESDSYIIDVPNKTKMPTPQTVKVIGSNKTAVNNNGGRAGEQRLDGSSSNSCCVKRCVYNRKP